MKTSVFFLVFLGLLLNDHIVFLVDSMNTRPRHLPIPVYPISNRQMYTCNLFNIRSTFHACQRNQTYDYKSKLQKTRGKGVSENIFLQPFLIGGVNNHHPFPWNLPAPLHPLFHALVSVVTSACLCPCILRHVHHHASGLLSFHHL